MVHIVPFKAAFETVVFHLVLLLNFMGCRELDPYFLLFQMHHFFGGVRGNLCVGNEYASSYFQYSVR